MKKYTYKDSGIEWLGEIPEHWKTDRVKDVSRLRDEKIQIKSSDKNYLELENLEQGTGKVIDFQDTLEVASKVMTFKKGDVLFGKLRPYLEKYYLSQEDGYCTGEILAIEPKSIDNLFFKYFIGSPNFIKQCDVFSYGAKMPRVNWQTQIGTFEIPLPPPKEQKAIAEYLDKATDRIDRIIAIKQEQLVKMEEMRKSIFFRACTQGLNSDSELIEINDGHITKMPSHWRYQRIKRGCKNIDTGKTPSSGEPEYFIDGTIEWFAPECFNDGLIIDKPKKLINEKAFEDNQIKIYPAQSVYFVAVGATAGKVGIIQKPSSCNQQINILETNFKLIPEFLAYQMKIIEKEIIKFAQYTTLPILNQAKTGYLQIAFPPIEEQKEIIEYLDNYTEKLKKTKVSINYQIKTLQAYRKSLIHECVTGKKQVTSAIKNQTYA
ncbi:restriction endonuclease subunit S [Flavobacteriaceae bacterium]|nr:restriction endonuclease subunit S [Flavobacteriaceae bacterium]